MFINSLCTLPECAKRRSCAHLGPVGEHCYFEAEKEICQLLNIQWTPQVTMISLLNELRYRLTGRSTLPDELPAQFQPVKSPDLSDLEPAHELKIVR